MPPLSRFPSFSRWFWFPGLFGLLLLSISAKALQTLPVGRYISQSTLAHPIQLNPLSEIVTFTPKSQTVGASMRELLAETGYALFDKTSLPGFDQLKLPRVHRHFQAMQIIEILHALAGPEYDIVLLAPLRQITFCHKSLCDAPQASRP